MICYRKLRIFHYIVQHGISGYGFYTKAFTYMPKRYINIKTKKHHAMVFFCWFPLVKMFRTKYYNEIMLLKKEFEVFNRQFPLPVKI
jgi:hypothetical protein